MKTYVVDIETYFDKEYTLKKLTTAEYLFDKRFRCLLVGWKCLETGEAGLLREGEITPEALSFLNDNVFVAHNVIFDGAALAWHYGVRPAAYHDTAGMGRALYPHLASHSLNNLAERVLGRHKLLDLEVEAGSLTQERFEAYCLRDVELCAALYETFLPRFPPTELALLDLVARMFIDYSLRLDTRPLQRLIEENRSLLVAHVLRSSLSLDELRSRQVVLDRLKQLGVPTPLDATTGKPTLSKNNPVVLRVLAGEFGREAQQLMEARLAASSNIERTRAERLIKVAEATGGWLPVPLKAWGAHTGRSSGGDRLNLQNLPRGSLLREAIHAPPGHKLVVGDASQIEARMLAWWCGQKNLLEAFAARRDVYSEFGSVAFGRPVDKKNNPGERYVAKTCILGLGYGAGAQTLLQTLKAGAASLDDRAREAVARLGPYEAKRLVDIYRQTYRCIHQRWMELDRFISIGQDEVAFHPVKLYFEDRQLFIDLPSGMTLEPRQERLWYGMVTENVIQALARIVTFGHALVLHRLGFRVALFVHDEIVLVVPDEKVEQARRIMTMVMRKPPSWAKGLPLDCEVNVGQTYAEAK